VIALYAEKAEHAERGFNAEIAETAKAKYLLCVLRGLCV
jgi:hypothetical protein